PTPRSSDHTATRLRDGRVLVLGGLAPGDYTKAALTTAEIYEPAAGRWTSVAPMPSPRQYHRATLLADGRVLATGGYLEGKLPTAVEIFDPATGAWSPTSPMPFGRMAHTATLLPDGKVLVAGGLVFGPDARLTFSNSAQVYDPVAGSWAPTAEMPAVRAEHTATLLAEGKVLLVGGHGSVGRIAEALGDAVVYEPAGGGWTTVGNLMRTPRAAHTATLLEDGSVLIVGGSLQKEHGGGGRPTPLVELYDPEVNRFEPGPPLRTPRLAHTATLLEDHRVLVVGGVEAEDSTRGVHSVSSAELYDHVARRWSPTAPLLAAPSATANREMRVWLLGGNHSATLVTGNACGRQCGEVLVIGGDGPTASAQLYGPPPADRAGTRKGGAAGGTGGSGRVALFAGAAGLGALILGLAWVARRRRAGRPGGPPRR
ncbi:MAG: Kelch repeat-containing protein, partial [Acidimicrobiales bacterium]